MPWLVFWTALHAEDDRPRRAVSDPKLQAQINRAIDRGIAHLKSAQAKDGSWEYTLRGTKPGTHFDGPETKALDLSM